LWQFFWSLADAQQIVAPVLISGVICPMIRNPELFGIVTGEWIFRNELRSI
jgi:hypothetical protein